MTSDHFEELRNEEEAERERADQHYAEERSDGIAALVPADWEKFDRPGVFADEIGATTVRLAQLNNDRNKERPAVDDPDCT